jgi:hypothetical protein
MPELYFSYAHNVLERWKVKSHIKLARELLMSARSKEVQIIICCRQTEGEILNLKPFHEESAEVKVSGQWFFFSFTVRFFHILSSFYNRFWVNRMKTPKKWLTEETGNLSP